MYESSIISYYRVICRSWCYVLFSILHICYDSKICTGSAKLYVIVLHVSRWRKLDQILVGMMNREGLVLFMFFVKRYELG